MRFVVRGALVVLCISSTARAQQPRRPARPAAKSAASVAVRAELATVLLQSGRYDEAAKEFRALLAHDPANFDYRLGLAHALAWGDHPREAEHELVQLVAKRPAAAGLDSLLRSVRDAYDPRAADAAQWVASEPGYGPYRVALARALVREGMYHLAIAHFDTLLDRPLIGKMPDRGTLLREIADAYVAAGDRIGGAERLRAALALTPVDTALRHSLAVMFVDSRRYADARAQYDTLIQQAQSGALLADRGRLRLSLGDRSGAESDLWASVKLQPSGSAYLLLGDLYRERGDYRGARAMYVAASQGAPSDVRIAVAGAIAQLDREERPALLAPVVGEEPGWRLSENAAADNLGVAYSSLALRRTQPVGSTTRLFVGAEWRQLAERTATRHVDASGYGATIGGWQEASYGPVLARLEVEGGGLSHALGGTVGEGRAALATWVYAWQANVEVATAPAYPTLFSAEALVPLDGGSPITEHDVAATVGGPAGPLDVAVSVQRSRFSDANQRLTIESYLRFPLGGNLYAVYAGSALGFTERSTQYWDPDRYMANAAGIEYALRRARGFSFAARVLPSYATSDEASVISSMIPGGASATRGPLTHHTAVQFAAGTELGYRVHAWEAAGALSYGRGRAGDYQRVGASIIVRLAP